MREIVPVALRGIPKGLKRKGERTEILELRVEDGMEDGMDSRDEIGTLALVDGRMIPRGSGVIRRGGNGLPRRRKKRRGYLTYPGVVSFRPAIKLPSPSTMSPASMDLRAGQTSLNVASAFVLISS